MNGRPIRLMKKKKKFFALLIELKAILKIKQTEKKVLKMRMPLFQIITVIMNDSADNVA